MKRIGFIGLGKLGLDCAEVFSQQYPTCGYDIYPKSSYMVKVYDNPADVVENSDWIFIAVPTPHAEGYDGSVPSSHMEPRDFGHEAVEQALGYINEYATEPKKVVLISTVLPGTTRRKFATLLKKEHQFLYNPYLIAMGSVKWDMANPEMVMIGTETGDPAEMQELVEIYKPLMQNNPRYVTGTWDECEAIKIFYNTFISAKVGLANMIQDFALKIGNINVDVVTDALANSTMRIMGPKYMTAGMGDAGACHPRDNIALRWLAQEYDIGYDMFDTIMHAREIQAKNLAEFLIDQATDKSPPVVIHGVPQPKHTLPIVIHGKAYKPDVPYCIGSYSTLVGHYIKQAGHKVCYIDPLADDQTDVVEDVEEAAVILMAHNRKITYGYTGEQADDLDYFKFKKGSIIVDPWRKEIQRDDMTVIHYGNTRK
jgi:UDPglucose 6-dehydrogenase